MLLVTPHRLFLATIAALAGRSVESLADLLREFTTSDPAAVELHATFSGFSDEVSTVVLAPDAEAERQFLPEPSTLRDRLLLADRGHPDVTYFEAVREHGGMFIVRLTRSHDL